MGRSCDDYATWTREREAFRPALTLAAQVPPDWERMPVGRIVRRMRRELGLKQWQLASRLGMRQSMLSRIERGADLRMSTLKRLFEALGCGLALIPATRRGLDGLRTLNRLYERQRREEGRKALAEDLKSLNKN